MCFLKLGRRGWKSGGKSPGAECCGHNSGLIHQVKYYNAQSYEVDRYREAIIKYQVRMLV